MKFKLLILLIIVLIPGISSAPPAQFDAGEFEFHQQRVEMEIRQAAIAAGYTDGLWPHERVTAVSGKASK